MARLDKTLADYIAIAISPVLIMLMLGSLMYFFVAVCYRGAFDGHIYWVLGCYTLAIVLITRIAIEESTERAMLFGAALVFAVGLAVMRFSSAGIYSWVFLGVAWWFAHKLTWDCTLIDEEEDSSGQGLLRMVGLGKKKAEADEPAGDQPADDEPEGVTQRVSEMREAAPRRKPKGKPHAPGVWIVYFSLAALPLFGLGNLFIPSADLGLRRWGFQLLATYVASGLGLLVTTSFLGLRRYLRQRDIEMPNDMASVWMALGTAMIMVLLFLAALLPRPAAEFPVSQFPLRFTSPERESSRHAVGNEGADRNAPDSQSHTQARPEQENTDQGGQPQQGQTGQETSESSASGSSKEPSGKSQGKSGQDPGESGQQQGEPGKPSPGQSDSAQQFDPSDPSTQKPQEGPETDDRKDVGRERTQLELDRDRPDERSAEDRSRAEQDRQKSSQDRSGQRSSAKDSRQRDQAGERSGSRQSTDQSSRPEAKPSTPSSKPPQTPRKPWFRLPRVSISFGGFFKLLFYAALIGLVGYWAWKSRVRILAAIGQFLRELRDFWARLFGGKHQLADESAEKTTAEKPRFRPFSAYTDPFASGTAGRVPPEEVVRYTFEALEAWARENGCPRGADETPQEFARHLGSRNGALTTGVKTLARLYGQVAYASGRVDAKHIGPLKQLWQQLKTTRLEPARSDGP
ncbi:MAG: DUF4129 domain-containing protein [Pirellulales bacterium]|nr:DUF4129 domain-containing protein [Pirellulales bacterium]